MLYSQVVFFEEVPFFAGSVLYRVLEREAIEWEKRVQDVSISSGSLPPHHSPLCTHQVTVKGQIDLPFLPPNWSAMLFVFLPDYNPSPQKVQKDLQGGLGCSSSKTFFLTHKTPDIRGKHLLIGFFFCLGLKFKDLSRVQVNMFNFLYPEVRFTNVVFNPLSSISIIHDGFILWRLSNAFVVSHGILKGMIIRRWLAKALTYSPSTSRKLMSLKVKHK
jgi:hypothetical protein